MSENMASWQYLFLFPPVQSKLRPAHAVDNFTRLGLEFDSTIRLCIQIDDDGHFLDVGDKVALTTPHQLALAHFLEQGKSLSIQARNSEIAVSCQFVIESPNPHISLGWSRHLLEQTTFASQGAFWKTMRAFARDCGAAYAIVVDDAPDYFEDRFIEIDQKRILDTHVEHRYGLGVRQLWLQTSFDATLPEGLTFFEGPRDIGDGFKCYFVANGV